ncbi:MAG: hypothetical protein R8L53_04560 [Mariprofundales bacterium]
MNANTTISLSGSTVLAGAIPIYNLGWYMLGVLQPTSTIGIFLAEIGTFLLSY